MKRLLVIPVLLIAGISLAAAGLGISSWPAFTDAITDSDLFAMTDVSDISESDSGTNKKATMGQVIDRLDDVFEVIDPTILRSTDTYAFNMKGDQSNLLFNDGVPLSVKGTATLGTASIASGACATTVTAASANVSNAAGDVVVANIDGSPVGLTGYAPSVDGGLFIYGWTGEGNVNFAVCNNTADPITPGAATLNWQVIK